jgi:glycosyltransferase involved in cell wall biosynthesis
MNILMFHPTMDIGGAPINNIMLATKLQEMGHQAIFLADAGRLVGELETNRIRYRQIKTRDRGHLSLGLIRDIASAIREEKADLVWTSGIMPCIKAHLACWLTNTPLFPLHGSPNVALFYLPKVGKCGWVNPHHRDHMVKTFGWKDEDVILIRGRMEVDRYQPLAQRNGFFHKYGVQEDEQIIALIGNVIKEKWGSVELFLQAAGMLAGKYRNLRFIIVGDGLEENGEPYERCKILAKTLNQRHGREAIILTGALRQISEVMGETSIVAGMASTCVLSLLCGRPTVVVGNQGFSGVVTPETFDELAYNHFNMHEPSLQRQPEALCRQLEGLLDDASWREGLGEWSHKTAVEIFDVNIGARQFEQVLRDTVATHKQDLLSRTKWLMEILRSLGSAAMYKLRKELSGMTGHNMASHFFC